MTIFLHKIGNTFLVNCSITGKNKMDLLAVIDSGASMTYVTRKTRIRANLKYKGSRSGITCVHGNHHRGTKINYYRGTISLGTKFGDGVVYELDACPVMLGRRVDAILGHDILRYFKVMLNWRDGTGTLEE